MAINKKTVLLVIVLSASASLLGCLSADTAKALPVTGEAPPAIPGPGVTVYAAGDIADCKKFTPENTGAAKTARLTADGLAREPGAAVLSLGDHTYPDGLIDEFLSCYGPTWGQFRDRTYPAPGNHEYYSPAARGYYQYFGDAAGPQQRGYYSFKLGEWHVVSLNSNLSGDDYRMQLAWLKNDLKENQARCTLAYWHHPLFSSGGHGNNPRVKALWQILEAAGADVVLASHDHGYERFARQNSAGDLDMERGMRSFVVGTGGAKLTRFIFVKANSNARTNSTHGVLRMALKPLGYEWEFMPVAGGKFTDRGAALCH
jgi:hypothetical protein